MKKRKRSIHTDGKIPQYWIPVENKPHFYIKRRRRTKYRQYRLEGSKTSLNKHLAIRQALYTTSIRCLTHIQNQSMNPTTLGIGFLSKMAILPQSPLKKGKAA